MDFTPEQFLKDVQRFYAASDLADSWWAKYPINAQGLDEDFPWLAAMVLWERLAPEVMNSERLDDMMQEGYELDDIPTGTLWLEVWNHLKQRFTPEMRSIEEAEKVFVGTQSLYNWCQDFEMALGNAALKDASFYQQRIEYCQEFCELFPASEWLLIHNMKRAIAESYFGLGQREAGEQAFKSLIEEFPTSAWAYIGWGDMYYSFRPNEAIPRDYEKAKQIYQMALAREVDDRQDVLDRLDNLELEYQMDNELQN